MAAADYRLCDLCNGKAFYDADLNYDGRTDQWGHPLPDHVGDWAVICEECAKTNQVVIRPLPSSNPPKEEA